MTTIREIFDYVEQLAPTENRCKWDNDGLQVCDDDLRRVDKVILCLDVTDGVIDLAIKEGAGLIISHHPLIFSPICAINPSVPEARLCMRLLENKISHISAHTRLDKAIDGVNENLARLMKMRNTEHFGEDDIGIIGDIDETTCKNLALFAKKELDARSVSFNNADKRITRLAAVCGSGKDFLEAAFNEGADALLTGDVSYTAFVTAERMGIALIDAGHYYTEFPILEPLSAKLKNKFPSLCISVYKEAVKEEV